MRRRTSLLWTWLVCVAAQAADPPLPPSGRVAPTSANTSDTPATPARPRPPLDLRIGDIRKYMTPEEFRAAVSGNDEPNTVIVEANRVLLPMKSELDVPGGLIAPFWALAHPTQAWRIFLPDPRVKIEDIRPPDTKIPPPVFRWGP